MRTVFEHEGDIRSVDLLACLVALWRESASGSLQFSRSGATAGFEITAGEIVASSSSDSRFETAAILVRAGKLDTRTLERLASPEGADRALLALQAGVLTRREYRWGEKIRAVEILSDLLTWLEGEYFYFRTTEAGRESTEPRLPIPRLVLELFLRSRDRSLVLKHLGGADVPLARASHFDAEFSTFGLTADAESVVRLIDGTASAEEIASEAPAEAFAVEKLLAALVTLGLVHPAFAPGASEGRALAPSTVPVEEPDSAEPEAEAEAEPEEADEAEADAQEEEVEEEEGGADERVESEEPVEEAGTPEPEIPPQESVEAGQEQREWELGEDFGRDVRPKDAPMLDVPFSGRPPREADLETAALQGEPVAADTGGFDEPRPEAGSGFDRPLDSDTGVGIMERPAQRTGSPLLWVLAVLGVAVLGVLWMKSRGGSPPPSTQESPLATTPTEIPAAAVAEVATSVPVPATEVPTAAPTAVATAPPTAVRAQAPPRSKPTTRPARGKPTPAPAPAPASEPAPVAAGAEGSRQHWLDRAARDAKRLAEDRKTHYAIQLELACEASSLTEAFQHDRPAGSMWVLTTSFEGKTCFRVLWGRYATIEAARRALSGSPRFFSTPKNHPAVTGVR
jgi:hypothetical protein